MRRKKEEIRAEKLISWECAGYSFLVKFIDRQPEMSRAFRQSIGLLTLIRLLALRARSLSAFGNCGW